MKSDEFTKPEHMSEQDWVAHRQWMAELGLHASEGYAEHLARVVPDADHSKALLQARYRALHTTVHAQPDMGQAGKD